MGLAGECVASWRGWARAGSTSRGWPPGVVCAGWVGAGALCAAGVKFCEGSAEADSDADCELDMDARGLSETKGDADGDDDADVEPVDE